mgnify:CR=1 FL=1
MDKSPLCTCLIKQDLEEAADPYEFLDKNYSISGILDNLDKLSPKRIEMCLLPVRCGIAESLQEEKAVVEDGIVLFVFIRSMAGRLCDK